MISTDRSIFLPGSDAYIRMREYASLAEELHIIVFACRKEKLEKIQIAPNCVAHPTNSFNRWWYITDAYDLAKRLFLPAIDMAVPPIDLITTQDPFETGLSGLFIARMLHRPLHLQVHTDLFAPAFRSGSFLNAIRVRMAKFLLHRGADVRVVSERIRTSILHQMKFSVSTTPRITVLPVFVDTNKFINTPPSFSLHEQYQGFDLLVLVVARLEKEKNVLGAIRLVEEVTVRQPNTAIGLVIVGSGSQENMLRKYALRAGIADRVFFCGWQSDLVSFYKTADVLLVTSLYEGYPRMFIEAAASGCPILTPDIGSASDILFEWNSIICPENDEVCLFQHLGTLTSDRRLRETFLQSARAGVKRMNFQTKEGYLEEYRRMWEHAAENDTFAPEI